MNREFPMPSSYPLAGRGIHGFAGLAALLVGLFLPGTVPAESPRGLAEQLLERSGFSEQIAQIPLLLQQQLAALEQDESTSAEVQALVSGILLDTFEPKHLQEETVTNLLEQDARPERLRQVLGFLESALGRRLTALEVAAATPEGQRAIRDHAAGLAENPPAESRVILIG